MNVIIDTIKNTIITDWGKLLVDDKFINNYKLTDTYNKVSHLLLTGKECVDYYPQTCNIFKCFNSFNIQDTKIVLLGQDPYHNKDKNGIPYADGLSFSFNKNLGYNIKAKYSLSNIFKEINKEFNVTRTTSSLQDLASQGVLLLNTILTVRPGNSKSHNKIYGWETFTNAIIRHIDINVNGVDFLLLGKEAEKKKDLIINKNSNIIIAGHPSPLNKSGTFLGSNCFLKCKNKIKWG